MSIGFVLSYKSFFHILLAKKNLEKTQLKTDLAEFIIPCRELRYKMNERDIPASKQITLWIF